MDFINTIIKILKKYLYKFMKKQVITFIIVTSAMALVEGISEVINELIKDINSKIISLINEFENFLFTTVHNVFLQVENVLQDIQNSLSQFSSMNANNDIKTSLQNVLEQKKTAVNQIITSKKATLTQQINIETTSIDTQSAQLIEQINTYTDTVLNVLQNKLKPKTEKWIKEINQKLSDSENDITNDIQISDFLSDIDQIDQIMDTIDTEEVLPAENAHKARKKKVVRSHLSIQDIYRILNTNFSRNERIALVFTLAQYDIKVSEQEITELIIQDRDQEIE